jgi:hypothetical protein
VQVVDEQRQRTIDSQVVHEPIEAVQHREPVADTVVGHAEQRTRQGRRTGEQRLGVGVARDRGLDQLAHATVREAALELRCACAQADEAGRGRAIDGGAHQARLADACRRLDQLEGPLRALGSRQRSVDGVELPLPFE